MTGPLAAEGSVSTPDPVLSSGAGGARRLQLVAWAALLAPALLLLWTAREVWSAYSPTPYSDQWVAIGAMRDAPKIGWLAYLFSQHNEHRILVSRLVLLADWSWFQGRNAFNLAAAGVTQLAGAAVFVHAALRRRPSALGVLGMAVAVALIVSLLQWENLFWGFQVCFVAVYAAAAWAIYLFCRAAAGPDGVGWGALVAAMMLLAVATYSMANGIFAGAAMVLTGIVGRRRPSAIVVAALVTAALLAIYLHGYHRLESHSPISLALQHPGRFLFYVAVYLGNLWVPGVPARAVIAGLIGAAGAGGMLLVVARERGADPVRSAMLGLVLFVGMSAAVTSLARLILGVEQAMASRYMTPTAYFWAAQAVFWSLTLQRPPTAAPALRRKLATAAQIGLAVGLVLGLGRLIALQPLAEAQLANVRERVLTASSALLGGIDDPAALRNVFPEPAQIQALAPYMRAARVSLFADPPVARVGARFAWPLAAGADTCRGAFDVLAPDDGGAWRATGWGWDLAAGRRFSRVVAVDETGQVLGIGLSGVTRVDVRRAVRQVRDGAAGWIAILRPAAGRQVIAYGITAAGRACELGRRAWRP